MRNFLDPRIEGGIRWAHVHGVLILIVLLASTWAAVGGFFVAKHQQESGGYKQAPLNAPTIKLGGTNLPNYWSLEKFSQRIHNQGTSNSCVGQTISTITEIVSAERGVRQASAGGYIWDELNGGIDQPISYSDAFPLWIRGGQAPLWTYGYDGTYPGSYPWSAAQQAAYPYRAASWGLVSPWDRVTIKAEIHDGLPLAVALPVYSSLYNSWGVGSVNAQWGSLLWNHSLVAVGYTPSGVILQNSWGDAWGIHGRIVMSWQALGTYAFAVVAITPVSNWPSYHPKPKPKPKPHAFPRRKWGPISPYWHHKLSWSASIWLHHENLGRALDRGHWHARRHFGFTQTNFQHGTIWMWPRLYTAKVSVRRTH